MKIVVVGGGHGTAINLRALAPLDHHVHAVITVGDDGGSSGRLRRDFGVPALGDLRRCVVAAASGQNALADVFDHRFDSGPLSGHPLGNLFLASAIESGKSIEEAVDLLSAILGARAKISPATLEGVKLIGRTGNTTVRGQTMIAETVGLRSLTLEPNDSRSPTSAVAALEQADLVILGPGSLFTSIVAAALPVQIRDALTRSKAHVVLVPNIDGKDPESQHLSLDEQLITLHDHGIRVDAVLHCLNSTLQLHGAGVEVLRADVSDEPYRHHSAAKLSIFWHEFLSTFSPHEGEA